MSAPACVRTPVKECVPRTVETPRKARIVWAVEWAKANDTLLFSFPIAFNFFFKAQLKFGFHFCHECYSFIFTSFYISILVPSLNLLQGCIQFDCYFIFSKLIATMPMQSTSGLPDRGGCVWGYHHYWALPGGHHHHVCIHFHIPKIKTQ